MIEDIVLSGKKGDGESKEDRSKLEDGFIEDLENLRGCFERLKAKGNLPSKLAEAITVLAMVANWGIGNNISIITILEKIKKSLEEEARRAEEGDIQPSLKILDKQVKTKNKIAIIDFNQIKCILTRRVKGQAKNKKELSISNEKNQKSVYEILGLRFLIAEFLEDVRDKIIFLFRLSKSLAIDSKITGNLNLSPYRKVVTSDIWGSLINRTLGLKKVSLSECKQLVNEDIEALVKKNASLTSLDLSWCKEITDQGLKIVVKGCSKLEKLIDKDAK